MIKPPKSVSTTPLLPRPTPHQFSLTFDAMQLQAMSRSERSKVLSCLANLLMQAAGAATEECDDDER